MFIEYRKKTPYFKKYYHKIETCDRNRFIKIVNGTALTIKYSSEEFHEYIKNNFNEDDYFLSGNESSWPDVYLVKREDCLKILKSKFSDYIFYVYMTSPGYIKNNKDFINNKAKLWHNRYPYKFVVLINTDLELNKILTWCEENVYDRYRKSGYKNEVSFYFLNQLDATSFKMHFSDIIVKTYVIEKNIASKILKNKILEAQNDLKIFLEGINDD